MTTKVTVEAHCSDKTEVQIIISNDGTQADQSVTIQHGETWTGYVHDAKSVHVMEGQKAVLKE